MRDVIPSLEEFKGLLKASPSLSAMFEDRLTTVAQVAVFRPTRIADAGAHTEDSTVRCAWGGGGKGRAAVELVATRSGHGRRQGQIIILSAQRKKRVTIVRVH